MTSECRARLATLLTDAFVNSTQHRREIFGIRFLEYEDGHASVGGEMNPKQPYLHALLYCPRLKRSQKQELARSLTEAFTTALDQPSWKPVIHICEHPYDNVVVEGALLSDRFPECAERKFYFDLPKDG